MRVIAGEARGTRLAAPKGMRTRPTADRVREALFSIILSRFELRGTRVLDICAGTGSLGIEALSRGAAYCCFIENDRNALAALRHNLSAAHCAGRAGIMEIDAQRALRQLAAQAARFDIVFFDPPYGSGLYATVPEMLSSLSLLAGEGLFIAECAARAAPMPDRLGGLVKDDRRIYGDTALEFYKLERNE